MIKLAIGLPAYNSHLDVGHAAMWLGFGMALSESQEHFELVSYATYSINGIDLARNTICYDAMKAGADWLLSVDADTFHAGEAANGLINAGVGLLQMIRDANRGHSPIFDEDGQLVRMQPIEVPANNNGVGFVGAPVRGRGVGDSGVCVQDIDGAPIPLSKLTGKVQPVGRIGAACIGVNLDWLRRYWPKPPWFEMHHDYTDRPRNARGEDYSICDGIRQRGGAVLCDGRFVPDHVDRRRLVGETTP